MKDIEQQAAGMLMRAKQQAESLLAEAQKEAETLKQQAKALGSAEGKREGLANGLDEGKKSGHQQALNENKGALTHAVQSLTQAMLDLDASRRDLEAHAVRQVIELAIAIARRVTKHQGLAVPDVLSNNVIEAMKLVVSAADLRIAVHPDQRKTLEDALPRLKLEWPSLEHVELTDDASLAPGGCRIFTRQGLIDADLDMQLDRVVADLLPSAMEASA